MSADVAIGSVLRQAFHALKLPVPSSIEDGSSAAASARDLYPEARDTVLGDYDWSCARGRFVLATLADASAAPRRMPHAFAIPEAVLTIHDVMRPDEGPVLWLREGATLYSDASALVMRATVRMTNELAMSAHLRTAIALQLAVMMQPGFVASRVERADLERQLEVSLERARKQDRHSGSTTSWRSGETWAGEVTQ